MTDIAVCADHASTVALIERAAADAGRRIRVLVEIDVMGSRCGVQPGAEAAELARRIAASPHLVFGGLQAYHGSAQHLRREEERRSAIAEAVQKTTITVEAIRREGLDCAIIGGAGTGTFAHEAASGVYTRFACVVRTSTRCSTPDPPASLHRSG